MFRFIGLFECVVRFCEPHIQIHFLDFCLLRRQNLVAPEETTRAGIYPLFPSSPWFAAILRISTQPSGIKGSCL